VDGVSGKCDYFGRPMVKRLPHVKCRTCGRVVPGARTKGGQCLGCAKGKTSSWGSYAKTGGHVQSPRAGSLL